MIYRAYALVFMVSMGLSGDNISASDLLFVAQTKGLFYYNLSEPDGPCHNVPVALLTNVVALDYDPVGRWLYWSDVIVDTIARTQINGSVHPLTGMLPHQEIIKNTGHVDGLILDLDTRHIYWTDTGPGLKRIERANMDDGSERTVLVSSGLGEPRAIVLDKTNSMMYWTDWGGNASTPRIERAGLDGNNRQQLITTNLHFVNALALDIPNNHMYWAHVGHIEVSHLDGSNRRVVWTGLGQPFGMTLYGGSIYWTDWQTHTVTRIPRDSPTSSHVVLGLLANITSIKVIQTPDNEVRMLVGSRMANHPRELRLDGRDLGRAWSWPDGHTSDLGVEYYRPSDRVFWSTDSAIWSSFRNGTDHKQLINSNVGAPLALAISTSTQQLFWVDAILHKIERATLTGTGRTNVISTNLTTPRDIALDDTNSLLYWTNHGDGLIESSDYDGSNRKTLFEFPTPIAITVDPAGRKVYWTDLNRLHSGSLDGSFRQELASGLNAYSLTLNGGRLYWADYTHHYIGWGELPALVSNGEMYRAARFMGLRIVSDVYVPVIGADTTAASSVTTTTTTITTTTTTTTDANADTGSGTPVIGDPRVGSGGPVVGLEPGNENDPGADNSLMVIVIPVVVGLVLIVIVVVPVVVCTRRRHQPAMKKRSHADKSVPPTVGYVGKGDGDTVIAGYDEKPIYDETLHETYSELDESQIGMSNPCYYPSAEPKDGYLRPIDLKRPIPPPKPAISNGSVVESGYQSLSSHGGSSQANSARSDYSQVHAVPHVPRRSPVHSVYQGLN